MSSLDAATWPLARTGDALHALATHARLAPRVLAHGSPPESILDEGSALARWIDAVGRSSGIAVEAVETTYSGLDRFLRRCAPALIHLPGHGVVALAGRRRSDLLLVAPDRTQHAVPAATLRQSMVDELERTHREDVDQLLDEIEVPELRRAKVRQVVLSDRLGSTPVGQAWLVRLPEGTPVAARLRRTRIPARLAALVVVHAVEYGLWLLAWTLVGRAVLEGRLDLGWLIAWLLLLVTLVPLRAFGTWLAGTVTVETGGLVRRRVLAGALRLDPEEVRHQGVGQLLGRVLEADAFDALALSGGLTTLTAGIEIIVVFAVLLAAGDLLPMAALLASWLAFVLILGWRLLTRRTRWAALRLEMTYALVERMVGHRTRQAQEVPDGWHDAEDQALEQYVGLSRGVDGATAALEAAASRGWLVVGLMALAPAFVAGESAATLAVALGCILLSSRALHRMASGLSQLAGAVIAWRQIAPLFAAAARETSEGSAVAHAMASAGTQSAATVASESANDSTAGGGVAAPVGWLLEAHDLTFRHQGRSEPALQECSFRIRAGDRLLLQGPSGTGKSTLASLLAGLRAPQGGLLLLGGLDRRSLGTHAWRRRVVSAPQFHENYVLSGTFLFNALMGTDVWPPHRRDLAEVEAICRELGLGDLLGRMPSGLFQMVGETGWQLSHGERSRLYVARALLQRADLVVLDESFAALDPVNLEQALQCVLARAHALVVIAHP